MRDGILGFIVEVIKYPYRYRKRIAHNKAYNNMLTLKTPKDRFAEIYKLNLWSSVESGSGPGSEIAYTTNLRSWLIEIINSLNLKTFVDAPCGDFNWMKYVLPEVEIKYIGLDIVGEVIERNISLYASNNIEFRSANICEDKLPDCDIVMVRDCLFHLSYEDINNFLINLSKTNYKYFLTTTHIVDGKFKNSDITTGDYRLIDLFSQPFGFNKENVLNRVDDSHDDNSQKREMILLEKGSVPRHLPI